jgi:ferrous iron transport protein B
MARIVTLTELRPGEQATIVAVEGQGVLRRRCVEMGLTRGEQVRVTHVAPLGDPVAYRVGRRGYQLALRREEAAQIRVALAE